MVDFNNEGTVSRPPKDIVALIIIEKLYNFLEADESFAKTRMQGAGSTIAISRSRLRNLFLICHQMLQRKCKKEDYDQVYSTCIDLSKDCSIDDLMESFMIILQVLDDIKLIKLDTDQVYNRHRTEEANKVHGYG
jgi:hypothetical protein